MTLPRQFRRLRIALIGYGDIAKRIAQKTSGHGPRWLAIGRSAKLPDAKIMGGELGASFRNPADRPRYLAWDLDHPKVAQRIAQVSQAMIVLSPPADQHPRNANCDWRMRRLACAIRKSGRRDAIVYISTTGVYGDQQGRIVTETSTACPGQQRSLRRLDAELSLRPIGAHVLRVPGIYGHDRLPIARLAAGQPALIATDDVYTNHIHADDLARISWIALFRGRPGRITNAVDSSELKMADYFDAVADAAGLKRPPRISRDAMRSLGKSGGVHPMMLGFLSESRRVRTSRLQNELGVRLKFPTVAKTLEYFVAQGVPPIQAGLTKPAKRGE